MGDLDTVRCYCVNIENSIMPNGKYSRHIINKMKTKNTTLSEQLKNNRKRQHRYSKHIYT
jgi:hypothetical protein